MNKIFHDIEDIDKLINILTNNTQERINIPSTNTIIDVLHSLSKNNYGFDLVPIEENGIKTIPSSRHGIAGYTDDHKYILLQTKEILKDKYVRVTYILFLDTVNSSDILELNSNPFIRYSMINPYSNIHKFPNQYIYKSLNITNNYTKILSNFVFLCILMLNLHITPETQRTCGNITESFIESIKCVQQETGQSVDNTMVGITSFFLNHNNVNMNLKSKLFKNLTQTAKSFIKEQKNELVQQSKQLVNDKKNELVQQSKQLVNDKKNELVQQSKQLVNDKKNELVDKVNKNIETVSESVNTVIMNMDNEMKESNLSDLLLTPGLNNELLTYLSTSEKNSLQNTSSEMLQGINPGFLSTTYVPYEVFKNMDSKQRSLVRKLKIVDIKDVKENNTLSGYTITHISLKYDFDYPLDTGVLPDSLVDLKMSLYFNQPLTRGMFPNNLRRLEFGWEFNQPLTKYIFPSNLTHLTFSSDFNQPIHPGVLPEGLTHLTFDTDFNQPIHPGVLPEGLTHLTFGSGFNQPIHPGVLPEGLTHLTFGSGFNQPIHPGVLPEGLMYFVNNSTNNEEDEEYSDTSTVMDDDDEEYSDTNTTMEDEEYSDTSTVMENEEYSDTNTTMEDEEYSEVIE